jgi:hypothetical protein
MHNRTHLVGRVGDPLLGLLGHVADLEDADLAVLGGEDVREERGVEEDALLRGRDPEDSRSA